MTAIDLETARNVRETPERRREQLIAATMRRIAESGLSSITLGAVAREAGLTAGMINFHFDTKQKLLMATLQAVADEHEQACRAIMVNQEADAAQKLADLIEMSFSETICSPEKLAVWYAFWGEATARQDYVTTCRQCDEYFSGAVLSLIRGLRPGDGDTTGTLAIARGLAGLMDVLWQDCLVEADGFDRAGAIDLCRQYLANHFPLTISRRESKPVAMPAPAETGGLCPTLPAWTYCDDDHFAREMADIHLPAWQVVCHVSDIPGTGDFQTFDGLGKRAFVIRKEDGSVAAYHNVCPHRAHALVSGAGKCEGLIRCPYHAWGFDLDGNLKAIAAKKTFPPFDSGEFGLKEIECEVALGFVFIRFVPGGPTMAERLAPHMAELGPYRFEDMQPVYECQTEILEGDWKNVWDNYLEDYHFPTGHPGLFAMMTMNYDREPDDASRSIRLAHHMRDEPKGWANRAYSNLLPAMDHLPEASRRRWSYFVFYPGFSFDVYPDLIDFFHVVPLAAGRSLLRYAGYGLPSNGDRTMEVVRKLNFRINIEVGMEDRTLVRSVQQGLASGNYNTGLLGEKEIALRSFQKWVREDTGLMV